MKTTNIDKMPPGPELDALVAEEVMGWQNVHRKDAKGEANVGKKQDKLGRWRSAKVWSYSTNPVEASAIDARMEELGLLAKYLYEVGRIAHAKGMPAEWATSEQRCRAALKAVRKPLRLIRRSTDLKKAPAVHKK
jgi:hypothetical protein